MLIGKMRGKAFFRRKRLIVAIALMVVVVVSGFVVGLTLYRQAGEYVVEEYGVPKAVPEPMPTPVPAPAMEGATPTPVSLEMVGRQIIYNAWLSIEVGDVDSAVSQIQTVVRDVGGYVAEMSISKGKESMVGTITVRVPQADFYTVIWRVEQLGELKDKRVGSEDVTERQIDLEARLENAQHQEKRLLQLLDKAYDVKDVLEIERELRRVREEVEVYMGQLQYLERRVEYATITVMLSELGLPPTPPFPEVNWDVPVKLGLQGLFIILQGLIVVAFILIPVVAVGTPTYYLYKRRRKGKEGS